MILVGKKNPKLINISQIISLELVKGKVTAFVKGKLVDDEPVIQDIKVREPWSIVIKTPGETSFINYNEYDEALEYMLYLATKINPETAKDQIERTLRKAHGQEKTT